MVVIGNADVGINLVALDRFSARAYARSNDRVTRQIIVNAYTHAHTLHDYDSIDVINV